MFARTTSATVYARLPVDEPLERSAHVKEHTVHPGLHVVSSARLCALGVGLALLAATLSASATVAFLSGVGVQSLSSPRPLLAHALLPVAAGRTLVVLVHAPRTEEYTDNLRYFVRKAVRCWHDADYRIVIQRDDAHAFNRSDPADRAWTAELPALPANARYVLHENKCLDWGSMGWLLRLPPDDPDHVDSRRYRYFILINSGVRGPFLPDFLEQHMDLDALVTCKPDGSLALPPAAERETALLVSWFHVFLSRLSADVRYVGCTLNCAYAAHVQSYVVAMDFVALQILWQAAVNGSEWLLDVPDAPQLLRVQRDLSAWQRGGGIRALPQTGPVLGCPADWRSTVLTSEIGSSQAIVRAGYNIAVLMRTWQSVDFRALPDPCAHESREFAFSGLADPLQVGVPTNREGKDRGEMVSVDPMEVAFVKYQGHNRPHTAYTKALVAWEERARETRRQQREQTETGTQTQPRRRPILFPHVDDASKP